MNLDDAVKQRPLEPGLDLLHGSAEGAATARASGARRIAGEELELGGTRGEGGELDGEVFDGSGGRRLLEARDQRSQDAAAIGGRILERHFGHPGGAVLEVRAGAHGVDPPPDAARVTQRLLDQAIERVREQAAVGEWRGEVQPYDDRLGDFAPDDGIGIHSSRQSPCQAALPSELRNHRRFGECRELAQRLQAETRKTMVCVRVDREDGERLGSEERYPLLIADHDSLPRLRAAGRDPGRELAATPPKTNGRLDGWTVVESRTTNRPTV